MDENITSYVGLDAHAESSAIGVAEAGEISAPRFLGTVGAKFSELTKALGKVGRPSALRIVYEAGPCGFAMVRRLREAGYHCEVVAPSKIPRRPGDRVKTDRRDALTLAGLARAGQLTFVSVPDERDEAMRDLSRAHSKAIQVLVRSPEPRAAQRYVRGTREILSNVRSIQQGYSCASRIPSSTTLSGCGNPEPQSLSSIIRMLISSGPRFSTV
jgi:hypothetical protein